MDEPDEAPDHYFTVRPRSRSKRTALRFLYRGEILRFAVDRGVFGASGLDPGTALLIGALDPRPTDSVLDVGCGWGAIGVAAAKAAPQGRVVLIDVNRRAVLLARENLRANGIPNGEARTSDLFAKLAGERFDLIASNPPFHAGRPLLLRFLEEVPEHLHAPDGRLLLVGKGSQGIRYYQSWLEERLGRAAVEVKARGGGYRVLEAHPGWARR